MWKSFGSPRGPRKTDREQWQPGTASVMAQYKKMILAPNGLKKKKKKEKGGGGGRHRGGRGGEGGAGRGGNSFANQSLALRSISSCQRVPGVNKVISFNPALQLYITPSYREYSGLSIEQEWRGGGSNLADGWQRAHLKISLCTRTATCARERFSQTDVVDWCEEEQKFHKRGVLCHITWPHGANVHVHHRNDQHTDHHTQHSDSSRSRAVILSISAGGEMFLNDI